MFTHLSFILSRLPKALSLVKMATKLQLVSIVFQLSFRQEFVIKISRHSRSLSAVWCSGKFLTPEVNIFNFAQPRNTQTVTKFEHSFSFKTLVFLLTIFSEKKQMKISKFSKRKTFSSVCTATYHLCSSPTESISLICTHDIDSYEFCRLDIALLTPQQLYTYKSYSYGYFA